LRFELFHSDEMTENASTPWRRPQDEPQPQVMVQRFCTKHERDVVRRLKLQPTDPWQATMTVVQILLFTWTTADPGFHRRTAGDAANMSLVLAEIGCLACYQHDGYVRAIGLIRERGLSHAAAVSRHDAADELWPIHARIAAMGPIVKPSKPAAEDLGADDVAS
jgi:hypothetical protein